MTSQPVPVRHLGSRRPSWITWLPVPPSWMTYFRLFPVLEGEVISEKFPAKKFKFRQFLKFHIFLIPCPFSFRFVALSLVGQCLSDDTFVLVSGHKGLNHQVSISYFYSKVGLLYIVRQLLRSRGWFWAFCAVKGQGSLRIWPQSNLFLVAYYACNMSLFHLWGLREVTLGFLRVF